MSHFLNDVYIAAGVVFLFGAAIFVHEFGHFWVARWRGLKIEEFAIGFGPKIVSWTRQGIQYSLRWIPAGGFVKLPQMMTSEVIEGPSNKDEGPLPPISALSKILVSVAGPAMNVVFAFAIASLIYFIGLPVAVNPPNIGYVDPKSPEGKMGIHEDDRIVAVDGKPVKSWADIYKRTALALTNVIDVAILHGGATNKGGTTNIYPLTAQANTNYELDVKMLKLEPKDHLVIIKVAEQTAAAAAHLQTNDEIVSFAGTPISSHDEFTNLVQACGGKKTPLVVKRANQTLTIEVTPALSTDPKQKGYFVGVVLSSAVKDEFDIEHPTPLAQVRDVLDQIYGLIMALAHSHDSGVTAKDLAGPVGIASMLALKVQSDYRLALSFLVLLNINLAILNLFPIPVLDGGHIVMAILEKIRRRPLELRFVEYTTSVFLVLIVCFMIYVTISDIKRLPLIHSLFKHQAEIEQTQEPANPAPAPQPAH